MIVPMRVDGAENEWCIVELQGELIPHDGAEMKNAEIGGLWYDNGVPTMRIGNHILAGKVVKLPKPFAILENHAEGSEAQDIVMESTSEPPVPSTSSIATDSTQFQVVGIARTRLIFSNRPKPVLT